MRKAAHTRVFLEERPRRCKAHMLEGMVRVLAQGHRLFSVASYCHSTTIAAQLVGLADFCTKLCLPARCACT